MTEQLRGFFTYRGLMKQVIATQKYMMVMQQMSRGIGGVKEKTAKQIESFIKEKYVLLLLCPFGPLQLFL